jgi:hypothetical protein
MEEEVKRPYKIMLGDTITVNRKDVREYTFYSTSVRQKLQDGTEIHLEKKLSFPKDTDIPDGTQIKIIDMFENGYKPRNSYDVQWSLFIAEYEIVNIDSGAFDEYNQSKEGFDINELDGSQSDYMDDLPF